MTNLREIAEADAISILADSADGFGRDVTVTDPAGTVATLTGFTNDIADLIDPETGQAVSGRLATVALSMSALEAAGLGLPEGISKPTGKPWQIGFDDIRGNHFTFKVQRSMPDRALGIITCTLEIYKPTP